MSFSTKELVLDREYFRTCFERLAEGCRHAIANSGAMRLDATWEGFPSAVRLECTPAYLDAVFAMGTANRKRSGMRSVENILAIWPDLFKAIFVQHLERQGGRDAVDRYAEYGYELPDGVHPSSVTGSQASFADSGLSRSPMRGLADRTRASRSCAMVPSAGLRPVRCRKTLPRRQRWALAAARGSSLPSSMPNEPLTPLA